MSFLWHHKNNLKTDCFCCWTVWTEEGMDWHLQATYYILLLLFYFNVQKSNFPSSKSFKYNPHESPVCRKESRWGRKVWVEILQGRACCLDLKMMYWCRREREREKKRHQKSSMFVSEPSGCDYDEAQGDTVCLPGLVCSAANLVRTKCTLQDILKLMSSMYSKTMQNYNLRSGCQAKIFRFGFYTDIPVLCHFHS